MSARHGWLVGVLGVILVAGTWPARADIITLDNGRTLRGKVVRRNAGQVTIQLDNGGRIILAAARVVLVEPENPVPASRPPEVAAPGPAEEEEDEDTQGQAGEPGPGKPGAKPEGEDPKLAARIAALIETLGASTDDEGKAARDEARVELVRIGAASVEPLCKALEDSNRQKRLGAARALGEIGAKDSVRPLLAAIYAGTPPKGEKAPWYERAYLEACVASFTRVTGARFNYDAGNTLAGGEAEAMLSWWSENFKSFPVQVGEKTKKVKGPDGQEVEERPDPTEDIRKVPKRSYQAPVSELHEG